jgi:hypothetical protein
MSRGGLALCGIFLFVLGGAAGVGGTLLWLRSGRQAEPPVEKLGEEKPPGEKRREEKPPPERWEATIYLPAPRRNANPFTSTEEADWNAAVGLLVREFEGATLGAEVEGLWHGSDGKLARETIRPIIVSFEPNRLEEFRRVLDEVGKRLKQEAVYARFEKPRVELRRINPDH